ncbi:MAG TPA: hypothetical protein VJ768_10490 [Anaerolineales bacterium]|nr:hypothetical protein [Anaerolineales bacterium]
MATQSSTPVHALERKVVLIVHNPSIPEMGGRPLSAVYGWNDPDMLVADFIEEIAHCSHGAARFTLRERIDVDEFPRLADGFRYSAESFVRCWRERRGFHDPWLVDYPLLAAQFNLVEKIRTGYVDEVWLFAFPYAGYYESIMAGPGAFWCNSPPLAGLEAGGRRFVIMGFNFERGVGEMLESFGHRAESILRQAYRGMRGGRNLWERFTRYDLTHPGRAEVGNVHFAPNSARDYDWGNRRLVRSRCDDWLYFPDLRGREKVVDCAEWGGGEIRLHHRWWLRHFPHGGGETGGVSNNWWEYVMDPERVR